jgi:hypothetical protein
MFPDFYDPLILSAWVLLDTWRECEIVEADASTQTAKVHQRGSLYNALVPFSKIQNVALRHAISGRIVQNFGKPDPTRPESIAYIRGYQDAYK